MMGENYRLRARSPPFANAEPLGGHFHCPISRSATLAASDPGAPLNGGPSLAVGLFAQMTTLAPAAWSADAGAAKWPPAATTPAQSVRRIHG
jgi:hypothetical protein